MTKWVGDASLSLGTTEKGCRPEPLFVIPSPFLSPRAPARGPSAHTRLGRTKRGSCLRKTWMGCRPEPTFFVAPSPFFCRPEASAEGSLGAYMWGPSALSCLGKTKRGSCLRKTCMGCHWGVAPSEARGPSALTRLGMTKREARLDRGRDALDYRGG